MGRKKGATERKTPYTMRLLMDDEEIGIIEKALIELIDETLSIEDMEILWTLIAEISIQLNGRNENGSQGNHGNSGRILQQRPGDKEAIA